MGESVERVPVLSLRRLREKAKRLKRELGITHGQALEVVAREANFPNWHRATQHLPEDGDEGGQATVSAAANPQRDPAPTPRTAAAAPGPSAGRLKPVSLGWCPSDRCRPAHGGDWTSRDEQSQAEHQKLAFLAATKLQNPLVWLVFEAAMQELMPPAPWSATDEERLALQLRLQAVLTAKGVSAEIYERTRDQASAVASDALQNGMRQDDLDELVEHLMTHEGRVALLSKAGTQAPKDKAPLLGAAAMEARKRVFIRGLGIEDPVDFRIWEASMQDDAKPEVERWLMSTAQMTAHASKSEGVCRAQGLTLTEVADLREEATAILMKRWRSGKLNEADMDHLLKQMTTHAGRRDLVRWQSQWDMDDARHALQEGLSGQREPTPVGTGGVDIATLFLQRRPTGPGPSAREYLALRSRDPEGRGDRVASAAVYECAWGFMTEDSGGWDFYSPFLWNATRKQYGERIDRFLTAWKNDGHLEAEKASRRLIGGSVVRNTGEFLIVMDDGISNDCCLTLWPAGSPTQAMAARKWIGEHFLPTIWPRMLARVMDGNYKFAEDWHCT